MMSCFPVERGGKEHIRVGLAHNAPRYGLSFAPSHPGAFHICGSLLPESDFNVRAVSSHFLEFLGLLYLALWLLHPR